MDERLAVTLCRASTAGWTTWTYWLLTATWDPALHWPTPRSPG